MSKARELAELGAVYDSGALSNRNVIINGGMDIAQRDAGSGTTGNPGTSGTYGPCDRFTLIATSGSTGNSTRTRAEDAPAGTGLRYSLKISPDASETPTGGGNISWSYSVEGNDFRRFSHGSSNAPYASLSFYVKSNKTGTYGVQVKEEYTNEVSEQMILLQYTINSADTLERKTFSWAGNTNNTSDVTTDRALRVVFHLASGPDDKIAASTTWTSQSAFKTVTDQVNFFDSTSNTWQITGVQLEVGPEPTPFEHRLFGEELKRCQRYYETSDLDGTDDYRITMNKGSTGAAYFFAVDFATTKRAKPSCSITQTFDDNLTLSVHTASTGRGHMGVQNATGGSTDTRALGEFTWIAESEI